MRTLAAAVLVLYAGLSLDLAPAWKNNIALWERVTVAAPTLARGWLNLAYAVATEAKNMQPARLYYEQARFTADKPHVQDRERRLVMSMADQALTLIVGEHDQVTAGFYMDEAMRLWPEGFPMIDVADPGPVK